MTLLATTPTTYELERDGQRVSLPRVTSVLALVRRFDGVPLDVLELAAERGQAIHRAIWLLEGGGDGSGLDWSTLHPELVPYVEGWAQFKRATGLRVVATEQLVISWRYGVAGRADLIVEGLSQRLDILDLKSGAAHPTHHLQVSAYLESYRETTGTKRALGRQVCYLRPTGRAHLDPTLTPETHARDWGAYLGLLTFYRWSEAARKSW